MERLKNAEIEKQTSSQQHWPITGGEESWIMWRKI